MDKISKTRLSFLIRNKTVLYEFEVKQLKWYQHVVMSEGRVREQVLKKD